MLRITTSCCNTRNEGEVITPPFSPSPIGRQLQLWVDDSHAGEDELRAEALKRIRGCFSRHCRELGLSGCNLREWPPFIPATVRHINASHNHLSTLPPVSLVQLESLDMQHNWLEELPAVYLGPLSWLNVTDNFIQTLSDPLYGTLERLRSTIIPWAGYRTTFPSLWNGWKHVSANCGKYYCGRRRLNIWT